MRKFAILFTALALVLSGLVFSPAQATAAVDGTYLCTTGAPSSENPNFTITLGVVSLGTQCAGAVVIPASVTSIGGYAFNGAKLTSITIPASVTSIGNNAFDSATALTSITIPASVTSIGDSAFQGATSLTSITVAVGNQNYSSLDGVLFNLGGTSLIQYPIGKSQTSYSIPASVTSIGGSAFLNATALTTITIPASVESIGGGAFQDATALTSITIPASVTSIGESAFESATALTSLTFAGTSTLTSIGALAFSNATALTTITIPASVTSIGVNAFYNANSLTSLTFAGTSTLTSIGALAFSNATALTTITIPASVESIGGYAFQFATALTSITFDGTSTLTSIGGGAFNGETSLTSITIPASVTSIGDSAFQGATSLTSITVADGNQNYSSLDGVLFNLGGTSLIQYPIGKSQTSYSIPASVTSIGGSAFLNATALTTITIPASVESIGGGAFQDATSLTTITIPASVTSIGDLAFFRATALTSFNFSGDAPTVGTRAFNNVAAGAKAYINNCATNFGTIGDVWNNLIVAIGVNDATCNDSAVATAPVPIVANGYRADKLATVYFSPLSGKLSKAAKKQIKAAVIANPSAVYKITGYVQKSISAKNAKNDASLSLARAKAIETHLASLGAGVTFTVVVDAAGVPAKNGKSDKARRATLYAMTPVVQ